AMAGEATLRRDVDAGERMQGLVNEVLRVFRSVGIGRVDEIDSDLAESLEHGDCGAVVCVRPPYPLARDTHGAVAQASDLEVTADLECACGGGGSAHRT